ncbi:MAG TPA: alpha-glucuronidase family glycosyl hydrolase [Polyangiaceae bacterium]|nr:alpha-glucuronidase family glycosyl hydrolase [Polyangiaceae bacterium]
MNAEDGYRLWLRYDRLDDTLREPYSSAWTSVVFDDRSATLRAAKNELIRGLGGLLGLSVPLGHTPGDGRPALLVGTLRAGSPVASLAVGAPSLKVPAQSLERSLEPLGREGFIVRQSVVGGAPCTILAANEDVGILYGVFHLLRHLQTQGTLEALSFARGPKLRHRMLQHWDNLDRTVERGYAGFSLWDWHKLPDFVSPQVTDYARANASVGINEVLLTNVNANALVLTGRYLQKVAALAAAFRPYGIRVYLSARFSAPIEIGGLSTADPLDRGVVGFWRAKAAEIYATIPDFGGFVVKANSEGQPGPGDYGRSHAEGANLLADALAPHGGTVFWRAFIYGNGKDEDRAKHAYAELVPLDGEFRENVSLQVKNGPIDFQPREPFHPLFGAMPRTSLTAEFQLTQEYLGFATHLAYLGTLLEETLDADTLAAGPGSTVARVLMGDVHGRAPTGIVAVANVGTDRNWCGHPFAQSNWYAFGRIAFDPALRADAIADEWIRMTFTNDERFVQPVRAMMLGSREAVVSYMTPLGLHHLMAWDHHYGPGPWIAQGRPDWTSVYFHRADSEGLGFDRSASGSNAIAQYAAPLQELFGHPDACPETLLLWFHHVGWHRRMKSGRTLWEELVHKYHSGVETVRTMRRTWESLQGIVDSARHEHVRSLLAVQEKEARWWRDACVLYFQTFSKLSVPPSYEPPAESLETYMSIQHYYVPGIPSAPPKLLRPHGVP